MRRNIGCSFVFIAAALTQVLAIAQDAPQERRPSRIQLIKPREKTNTDGRVDLSLPRGAKSPPAQPRERAFDRARELARGRIAAAAPNAGGELAPFGARGPAVYSSDGDYLVAAGRDGDGLAIWETSNHRRLRRLENSDRPYALLAISDDRLWIAAVRQDNPDQIDLWHADNGRHVRVIRAAGGSKSAIEFPAGDVLRITPGDGNPLMFSIPSGAAIDGFGKFEANGSGSSKRRQATGPRSALPSAPPTVAGPPPLPWSRSDRDAPPTGQGAPRGEPIEPRIPTAKSQRIPTPRMAPAPRGSATPGIAAPGSAAPGISAPGMGAPEPRMSRGPRGEGPSRERAYPPVPPTEDQPGSAAPDEPAASAPPMPRFRIPIAPSTQGSAAPAQPSSAAPEDEDGNGQSGPAMSEPADNPSGGAAPESADDMPDEMPDDATIDEAPAAPGSAAPREQHQYRIEMDEAGEDAAEAEAPRGGSAPDSSDDMSPDDAPEEEMADDGASTDVPPAAPDAETSEGDAPPPARQYRLEIGNERGPSASPSGLAPETAGGGSAPERAAPVLPPVGEAAPAPALPGAPARQYRIEMNDPPQETPQETSSAPAPRSATASPPVATAPTPAVTAPAITPPVETPRPTSVTIHYATNRNRLAPKDREWGVYFRGFFGSLPAFVVYGMVLGSLLIFPWLGKRSWAAAAVVTGAIVLCGMGAFEAYVRAQLRDELSGELYGCRPTDLAYGACEISVPPAKNRSAGELSRPVSVWVFEAPENPDKHFMLRHVTEHADKDSFYQSLSAQVAKSDAKAAMLFIHGYNVSFEDAIFRTAQLAVDLKFPGAPMAFCWPSYADVVKYTFDEQNAEVSIPALREVLEDLASRSGAKRIHIVAHSMGNRVLAGALRNLDPSTAQRNKEVFRELVLAAPDIDSRVFKSQVLPHIVRNTQHCTLYASSRDRALLMSRCFHNYQRLGETQPELVVASGLDTIDASLVDTSLLGHSYIGDVQSIVSDLHDLVVSGKRPTERLGLVQSVRNALKYWAIKPEEQTASEASLMR